MAKQKFKITNWHDYNKALRQRGSLKVWLDSSAIAAWIDIAKRLNFDDTKNSNYHTSLTFYIATNKIATTRRNHF